MKIKIKNANRFKFFCVCICIICAVLVQPKSLCGYNNPETEYVTVTSGDTLWSLASQYKNEGDDSRAYVEMIKEMNGLTKSDLQEGQQIKIPVKVQ